MKVSVTVSNMVPTAHNHRIIQPSIYVEDVVLSGETPQEAFRRVSSLANAFFARKILDQLRFTDRMVSEGNEAWCDEYLSTVAEDHPANKPSMSADALPEGVQSAISLLKELTGKAADEFAARIKENLSK